MAFTTSQILELYQKEALKHGENGTCTIQDIRTRNLEIEAIFSYLRDGLKILEIGCGNGFTAQAIIENFQVELDATDFSADMIALARERRVANAKGKVNFSHLDVLCLYIVNKYELIFTERCLQNLASWEDQKRALNNIVTALRPDGYFVMLESFNTGLTKLNQARKELALPEISPPWHNLFFDEETTKNYLESIGCFYVDQNPFLSGYYFGSRVLLPALLPDGVQASSDSVLNDYFCHLPPHSDFCPMKILRFRKG